jgi:hypothetical protein
MSFVKTTSQALEDSYRIFMDKREQDNIEMEQAAARERACGLPLAEGPG